ncbi:AAC-rich mRNA clone AAC11 protein-like isoform X2 [Dreissena polymorpha]|uniref:Uncharacterized protein n=1 Tax=Dreissena polymorpha TaxID=45954 RepID=A0A9D4D3E1_DREPO|nr:AAC-rich mRNA clone AAC11 protein-like isoform X2 [Dreissena polymorpha]KAH3738328.1 hypothetical protein DPMN_044962 [Dreissena polymorpha]
MKNSDTNRGGAKKFLYSGPKKSQEEDEKNPWTFNTKAQKPNNAVNGSSKVDLENVWSIQRNVNVGVAKSPKSDTLTFNTNKSYYSRHGGGNKDKDDFGTPLAGPASDRTGLNEPGGKTWNAPAAQSRRPFSYAFGADSQSTQDDKPVSPRSVKNSSTDLYPQTGHTGNMHVNALTGQSVNPTKTQSGGGHLASTVSQTGNPLNSGTNFNANRGSNQQGSFNFSNSSSNNQSVSSKPAFLNSSSNNQSVSSKPVTSTLQSIGVSQSYSSSPKNNLFGSSTNQNSLFGSSTHRAPANMDLPAYESSWAPKSSRSSTEKGSLGQQNKKSFW